MYRRRFFQGIISLLGLMALVLLVPVQPAHAAPNQGDEVILDQDFTLREGEHLDGDLVLIKGDLTMQAGSRVSGSVTVLGGNAEINGVIQAEVVVLGGDVRLGEQARVNGEIFVLGGQIHQAEGAQTGKITEIATLVQDDLWLNLRLPFLSMNDGLTFWSILWSAVAIVGSSLMMALLAMAVVSFWPSQTAKVGQTIAASPLPSLGIGCALYPLAMSVTFFILISLCLAPFVPFVVLLLVAASLFGWVALGTLWGHWLVRRWGWRPTRPTIVAGVGVFTLNVATSVVGSLPVLGPLIFLGAISIGLGAVALSRFGTSRQPSRSEAKSQAEV